MAPRRLLSDNDFAAVETYATTDPTLYASMAEGYVALALAKALAAGGSQDAPVEAAQPYLDLAAVSCKRMEQRLPHSSGAMQGLVAAANGQVLRIAGAPVESILEHFNSAIDLFSKASKRSMAAICNILAAVAQLRDAHLRSGPAPAEVIDRLKAALEALKPPPEQAFPQPATIHWEFTARLWLVRALDGTRQRRYTMQCIRWLIAHAGYVTVDGEPMHIMLEGLTPDTAGIDRLTSRTTFRPQPLLCHVDTSLL